MNHALDEQENQQYQDETMNDQSYPSEAQTEAYTQRQAKPP